MLRDELLRQSQLGVGQPGKKFHVMLEERGHTEAWYATQNACSIKSACVVLVCGSSFS